VMAQASRAGQASPIAASRTVPARKTCQLPMPARALTIVQVVMNAVSW